MADVRYKRFLVLRVRLKRFWMPGPTSRFDAIKQAIFQSTWEVQERISDQTGCFLDGPLRRLQVIIYPLNLLLQRQFSHSACLPGRAPRASLHSEWVTNIVSGTNHNVLQGWKLIQIGEREPLPALLGVRGCTNAKEGSLQTYCNKFWLHMSGTRINWQKMLKLKFRVPKYYKNNQTSSG